MVSCELLIGDVGVEAAVKNLAEACQRMFPNGLPQRPVLALPEQLPRNLKGNAVVQDK